MSNPPGLPPDPNAPPTAPMNPVPPSAPQPPSYRAPEPTTYPPPQQPPAYPPQSPAYPPQPTYPQAPTYPPAPGYPPPPPIEPSYQQPPGYPPPPAYQEPPAGYSVPAQYAAVPPGSAGYGDPLVLPLGAPFGAWFSKVQEVAKRSWKSALIIATLGIAVPRAAVTLISSIGGWGAGLNFTVLGDFGSLITSLFIGLLFTLVASVAACYVAAAGWAAGTWALVYEAQTGQPANISAAFRYGWKRAMALFPWTVLAAVAVSIASVCLLLPGVYVAFGFSMFGFVAIFERGANPVGRSFSLTHNSATIGPTLGKIGILFGIYLVYTFIVGLIFGAIAVGVGLAMGLTASTGYNVGSGLINAIGTLCGAPGYALLLIGLLPTYAQLRGREGPLSTSQLQHELGG